MFDIIKNRKFIVIGMEHYNPLGVIRSLGQCGIAPTYIAIKHRCPLASLSKYCSEVRYANNLDEGYRILTEEYGNPDDKPFVITTDDDIQSLIDLNWSVLKERFVLFNSGEDGRTTRFMDKKEILDCAERNGLPVLKTVVVDRGTVPEDIDYPIITKSISSNDGGWKSDVHICANAEELAEAFKTIQSERVIIQRFVEKSNEICVEGYSADGGRISFLPFYTTYNYNIQGYYSPYMTLHPYNLPELDHGLRAMIAEIGFEGFFEAEFLVDADGSPYFSEINFRNSTWSYAATKLGMPLPCLWAESMMTGSVPASYYRTVPKGYQAMVEPIDYKKRVIEGDTSAARWLADFKNADCLYYMDDDDPKPYEAMVENWELLG